MGSLLILALGNVLRQAQVVSNELFPIQQKGTPAKLTFAGDPDVAAQYHTILLQGHKLESSINEANFWLQAKRNDFMEKITAYMDLNTLAIDGQFRHSARKFKFAADSIHFLQVVHN